MLLTYERKQGQETLIYDTHKVVNGVEIPNGFTQGFKGLSWDNPIWKHISKNTVPYNHQYRKSYHGTCIVPNDNASPLDKWCTNSELEIAPCGNPVVWVHEPSKTIKENGWKIHFHNYCEWIDGMYFPCIPIWGHQKGYRPQKLSKKSVCERIYRYVITGEVTLQVIQNDLDAGYAMPVRLSDNPSLGLLWEGNNWVIWNTHRGEYTDAPHHYTSNELCKIYNPLKTNLLR